jgi:hypothetical protein
MSIRTVTLALLLTLVAAFTAAPTALANEGSDLRDGRILLAQEPESETESDEPAEETGAGQGETESVAEETGPPWTYQMARLAFLLLAVLGLGIGFWYWRLIASRQRSGV